MEYAQEQDAGGGGRTDSSRETAAKQQSALSSAGSLVREIRTEPEFEKLISGLPEEAVAVLHFFTTWAQPCKQVAQALEVMAASSSGSIGAHVGAGTTTPGTTDTITTTTSPAPAARFTFLSIDAEALPDLAEKYQVVSVPLVVFVQNRSVIQTVSGADTTKLRNALELLVQGKINNININSKSNNNPTGGEDHDAGRAAGSQHPHAQVQLPPIQPINAQSRKTEPEAGDSSAARAAEPAGGDNGGAGRTEKPGPDREPGPGSKQALFSELERLVNAAPVMLFLKGTPSAPECGFSMKIVGLLREHNIRYGFLNILADPRIRQGLKEYADWPTFPQLWVRGQLLGGLDIVRDEFESNSDFLAEFSVPPGSRP